MYSIRRCMILYFVILVVVYRAPICVWGDFSSLLFHISCKKNLRWRKGIIIENFHISVNLFSLMVRIAIEKLHTSTKLIIYVEGKELFLKIYIQVWAYFPWWKGIAMENFLRSVRFKLRCCVAVDLSAIICNTN